MFLGKKIAFVLFLTSLVIHLGAQTYPASNFTLVGQLNPETLPNADGDKYSGCWGWYQQDKKKEYAILGSQSGTWWVDVTNPSNPTVSAYQAGKHNGATWREIKTYKNYCYVISDDQNPNSFQIFDMQYLPDSVVKIHDGTSILARAHALWVDGNRLYISAVKDVVNAFSSMNVYDLGNPANPTLLRRLDQDYPFISYVHDMFVHSDTVFASCGYQRMYVFRFTPGNTFTQIGSLTTYSFAGYNHSSALTPNGKTLVFTDEVPAGLPIKVADVSNIYNIQMLAYTNQYSSTTPHNPFIVNDQYCFMSSYQEGLQLYDISSPASPTLAGYFDTYPQGGGNTGNWGNTAYRGQWGAYPYLPSKNILALDMSNGLFVLKTSLYGNPPPINTAVKNIASNGFKFFPNPVRQKLDIELPCEQETEALELELRDASGNSVLQKSGHELTVTSDCHLVIDLAGLNRGFYILSLSAKGRTLTHHKILIGE